MHATSQEIDGDQAVSDPWLVALNVEPIADGFTSWKMGTTVSEGQNDEGTGGVSFASLQNFVLRDTDGSETVIEFSLDLSTLIADAGIGGQLQALSGEQAGLDELVDSYIAGTFEYAGGKLLIRAEDISGVELKPELFLNSNQDFTIPVVAVVVDSAVVAGVVVTNNRTESGAFTVDLVGKADVPTVFANSVSGQALSPIPITLGGASTDTDEILGRVASEETYYIVNNVDPTQYAFVTGGGGVVGIDNDDGHWLLSPADLQGLSIFLRHNAAAPNETIEFELTSVAIENDGDMALNSTPFSVTVEPLAPGLGEEPYPLLPLLSVGDSSGPEDGIITLNVTASRDPTDPTSSTVSVVFFDVPEGAIVEGAKLNPMTQKWVARGTDVSSGSVQLIPPPDFSGVINLIMVAIASSSRAQKNSTGTVVLPVYVDPVADGVEITVHPNEAFEDEAIIMNASVSEIDRDGSEVVGDYVYLSLSNDAIPLGDFSVVDFLEDDTVVDGTSLIGWYRIPTEQLSNLTVLPKENWHGSLSANIAVPAFDGSDVKLSQR